MWVRLSSSGAEIGMGNIVNASVSGAFLETRIQLPLHSSIKLEPAGSAGVALEGLRLDARVARIDDRGLGIEWRALITPKILALLTEPPPRAADSIDDDDDLEPVAG
jgi:hypothetical protein